MKTIKIIDLLNKIANGEEVPKEIKIKTSEGTIAPFFLSDDEYINVYTGNSLLQCLDEFDLNDEVEILDEEDEFEDIEELNIERTWQNEFKTEPVLRYIYKEDMEDIEHKINQLIKNQKKIIEKLSGKNE